MSLAKEFLALCEQDGEEENEYDEDDIFIQDASDGGEDAWCHGKVVAHRSPDGDYDAFHAEIKRWMEQSEFYPAVWRASDHGNVIPYDMESQ